MTTAQRILGLERRIAALEGSPTLVKPTNGALAKVESIKQTVCDFYGIHRKCMEHYLRSGQVVKARHLAMEFTARFINFTHSDVANVFGRTPRMAAFAIESTANRMATDEKFKAEYFECEQLVKQAIGFNQ